MANNLDLPEVTLAQLADSTFVANDITHELNTRKDQPLKAAVVRVTDHDDDVTAEEDDADKMALFYSKAHGHPWRKGPALKKKIYESKPLGTGATATATEDAGVITEITVTDGGEGYQNPVATVDGGGSDAELSVTVVDGVITAITVDAGGTGYSDPVVTITDVLDAVDTDTTIVVPNFDYSDFE